MIKTFVKKNMSTKCSICLSKKSETIYKDYQPFNYFKKKKISLSICMKCGFLFQSPKPSKKFLTNYYSKNPNSSGNIFFERKNLRKTKYYARYQFLKKYFQIKNFKNILEIGSSNSSFLKILSDHNRKLTGIDPSGKSIKNIKIIKKFFHKNLFIKKKFDLICFFSVLEHVYDPRNFLKDVSQLQDYGGIVYLEIPNSDFPISTVAEFYNFEHISHFNLFSIKLSLI